MGPPTSRNRVQASQATETFEVSEATCSRRGGSDSKTAHSGAKWEETHRRIEARHDALPVPLPRGAATGLRAQVRREEAAAALRRAVRRSS